MKNLIQKLEGNPVQKKYNSILKLIKEERIRQELSQYEMGDKIGVSQNAYYKLEKGHTKLDLHRLIQIALILDIELAVSKKTV